MDRRRQIAIDSAALPCTAAEGKQNKKRRRKRSPKTNKKLPGYCLPCPMEDAGGRRERGNDANSEPKRPAPPFFPYSSYSASFFFGNNQTNHDCLHSSSTDWIPGNVAVYCCCAFPWLRQQSRYLTITWWWIRMVPRRPKLSSAVVIGLYCDGYYYTHHFLGIDINSFCQELRWKMIYDKGI